MSTDPLDAVNEPTDEQVAHSLDNVGEDVPYPTAESEAEAAELLEEAEDDARVVESEVTEEDMSSDDLIQDGLAPEAIEQDPAGIRATEDDLVSPGHEDTIDERVLQEEPEPGHDVVPRTEYQN